MDGMLLLEDSYMTGSMKELLNFSRVWKLPKVLKTKRIHFSGIAAGMTSLTLNQPSAIQSKSGSLGVGGTLGRVECTGPQPYLMEIERLFPQDPGLKYYHIIEQYEKECIK